MAGNGSLATVIVIGKLAMLSSVRSTADVTHVR